MLGSNIFNVFFTLGATALIKPVLLDLALNMVVINITVTAVPAATAVVFRLRSYRGFFPGFVGG